ncbi:VUT family protein [Sphingobacteriales bacterium CHB3]|nr:VUT family protein [Sphingobacteriales bacterium CHB3]
MFNTFLIALYVSCDLIANVTASKPVTVFGFTAPAGVFIYAATFTLVDLINERLGKKGARHVVYAAFAANILLAAYTLLVVHLPSPDFYTHQTAFAATLGSTPRIVVASLVAFIVSSLIDVEIFAWWKEKIGRHKWARVLTSNTVSTFVDSVVFVGIAFAGVLPLVSLIAGQYVMKMGITIVSIPLIYLVRRQAATARND